MSGSAQPWTVVWMWATFNHSLTTRVVSQLLIKLVKEEARALTQEQVYLIGCVEFVGSEWKDCIGVMVAKIISIVIMLYRSSWSPSFQQSNQLCNCFVGWSTISISGSPGSCDNMHNLLLLLQEENKQTSDSSRSTKVLLIIIVLVLKGNSFKLFACTRYFHSYIPSD